MVHFSSAAQSNVGAEHGCMVRHVPPSLHLSLTQLCFILSAPSIESRLDLRRKLRCQSFKWYLENVYPELRYLPYCVSLCGCKERRSLICLERDGLWPVRCR